MLKIEKTAETAARVTFFLSGRISDDQVSVLEKLVRESRKSGRQVVLDLEGVGIVDRRAVRFFLEGEGARARLLHTPVYVAEWLRTEAHRSAK